MIASRRRFLFGAVAAALAPSIVRAANIMPIKPYAPILWGDGIHDDTAALQHAIDTLPSGGVLRLSGRYRISLALEIRGFNKEVNGGEFLCMGPPDEPAFEITDAPECRISNMTIRNARTALAMTPVAIKPGPLLQLYTKPNRAQPSMDDAYYKWLMDPATFSAPLIAGHGHG